MLPITGAILAGGRSRRMAGRENVAHKGLLPLAGQPLLSHVISRLQPQCERLLLSVELADSRWKAFGLPQIADLQAGSQGPLGGLLAALQAVGPPHEWLLLAPCDAPFLPLNLADLLLRAATAEQAEVALVSYQQQWQPVFSLWHTGLLPHLRVAVMEQGQHGLKEFLRTRAAVAVEWAPAEPNPFFNINTPHDLAAAATLLDPPAVPIS